MNAIAILWTLFPAVKEFRKALRPKSEGGRRITPAERERILLALVGRVRMAAVRAIDRIERE